MRYFGRVLAQPLRQGDDRLVDQRIAALLVDLGDNHLARRGDRDIDGDGAYFVEQLAMASSYAF